MSIIAAIGNKLIKVGDKIGLYPGCCCEESCCCLDFTDVNFSFTIDCGGGNETFTGILNFGGEGTDYETGLWNISVFCTTVQCTKESFCSNDGPSCIGYIIIVSDGSCAANGVHLCPGTASSWTGGVCDSSPKANLTTDLFRCVGGSPVVIGSITFFP